MTITKAIKRLTNENETASKDIKELFETMNISLNEYNTSYSGTKEEKEAKKVFRDTSAKIDVYLKKIRSEFYIVSSDIVSSHNQREVAVYSEKTGALKFRFTF